MDEPRVLQVITDTDRRGAQVFAEALGRSLAGSGLAVETVALAAGRSGGVDVATLGPSRRHPRTLRALRAAMGEQRVTIAHGSTTLPACALAGTGPGRPFVYRQVSDPLAWASTAARRARVRAYYRAPSQVVALSTRSARVLSSAFGVADDRITVIPNAVDVDAWPPATDDDRSEARAALGVGGSPVVAFVGALAPEKGIATLLAAAPAAVTLLLAGPGDPSPWRDEAARSAADVRFLGPLRDPGEVYAAADVVVLPSHSEAQPAVLLEAALRGTPVVATAVGDVADLLPPGLAQHLVEPGSVDGLRAAIDALLADDVERARSADAARAHVLAHHSLGAVTPLWIDVLRRAAGRA